MGEDPMLYVFCVQLIQKENTQKLVYNVLYGELHLNGEDLKTTASIKLLSYQTKQS